MKYTPLFFRPDPDRPASLWDYPIRHGFSLMADGNMSDKYERRVGEAEENRHHFLASAGFDSNNTVRMIPKQGTEIMTVGWDDRGMTRECDGFHERSKDSPRRLRGGLLSDHHLHKKAALY